MNNLLKTGLILFISSLITCYNLNSQSIYYVDKWKEYIDNLAMDEVNDETLETLYSDLSYLAENPLELNSLTEEQLRKLPFLSDRQIENLLSYKNKYGAMISVYELKNVDEIDFNTLELLLPFVYIENKSVDKSAITVNSLLRKGRNNLYIRYNDSFQQKQGYKSLPDSISAAYPNRKYLGKSFYNSVRYSYLFDERIEFGFVLEKDGGEPFMNKYRKGYDYYSINLLIKDQKWLKTLVLGDYKIAFGQGLIVSNDYIPSKSAMLSQAERRNNGFRKHFSTNEYDFFRGVGATLNFRQFDLNLFYSNRYLDGSVDSLSITSLKKDGIHRLPRDWDKRNKVNLQTLGGNIRYGSPNFNMGITAIYYSFGSKRFESELRPYSLYTFRGKENANLSVDYMFKKGALKFYGETAMSANKQWATLNGIQIQPVSYASFLILYRNYNKKHQSFYGNSFSQNSSVQNEEGIYLGMQFVPFAYWKIAAYIDVFRFPWLKYRVDAPSSGKEYMGELIHTSGYKNSFSLRYRYKESEINESVDNMVSIKQTAQHRLRFQYTYTARLWSFKSQLDAIEDGKGNRGWMIGERISFQTKSERLNAAVYFAYFDTDNSMVQINSFEKNPLYVYYRPSFYGEGLRLSCSLSYEVLKQLTVMGKLATSHYFDRKKIGTDLETIEGTEKTDMDLILRWKF